MTNIFFLLLIWLLLVSGDNPINDAINALEKDPYAKIVKDSVLDLEKNSEALIKSSFSFREKLSETSESSSSKATESIKTSESSSRSSDSERLKSDSEKSTSDKAKSDTASKGAAAGASTSDKVFKGLEVAGAVIDTANTITKAFAKGFKEKEKKEQQDLSDKRAQILKDQNLKQDEELIKQFNNVEELGKVVNTFISRFDLQLKENEKSLNDLANDFARTRQDTINKYNHLKGFLTEMRKIFEDLFDGITSDTLENFEELDQRIKKRFRSLSQMDVLIQFTEEIMLDSDILESLMTQAMKFPTKDTKEDFIRQYKIKGPVRVITEIKNRIKYRNTNPIVVAMELHVFKSKEIFQNWISAINDIVYKLLIVEGFYYGIAEVEKNTSYTYYNPCFEAVDDLMREMHHSNFKVDPTAYWPDLIGYKVDLIMHEASSSYSAVEAIQNLLNGIHTTDVFGVHVSEGDFKENGNSKRKNKEYGTEFINEFRLQPIRGDILFTLNKNSSGITQINSFNSNFSLAASILRSETHYKRSETDNFELNDLFIKLIREQKSLFISNRSRFFADLNDKINDRLGGVVVSRKVPDKMSFDLFSNGKNSPLYWYNRVPMENIDVNIMWI